MASASHICVDVEQRKSGPDYRILAFWRHYFGNGQLGKPAQVIPPQFTQALPDAIFDA